MISQSLPSIRSVGSPWAWQLVEAHAFAQLALHGTAGVPGHSMTSFQRAWGFASLEWFPQSGTLPSFICAFFPNDTPATAIVAIQSTSGWLNSAGVAADWFATHAAGIGGHVSNHWWQSAINVRDGLLANGPFAAFLAANRDCQVVFTGNSQGAAVAEVAAALCHLHRPSLRLEVFKFSAPRVGTANWYAAYPQQIGRHCYYLEGDPIHFVPFSGAQWWTLNPGSQWRRFFVEDPNAVTIGQRNFNHTSRGDYTRLDAIRNTVAGGSGSPPIPSFYWHASEAYRWCFSNFVWQQFLNTDLFYRWNFLELPGENNWQRQWAPNQAAFVVQAEMLDPAPADEIVPVRILGRLGMDKPEPEELDGGAGGGGDDWGGGFVEPPQDLRVMQPMHMDQRVPMNRPRLQVNNLRRVRNLRPAMD